jgi:hypothetical protein
VYVALLSGIFRRENPFGRSARFGMVKRCAVVPSGMQRRAAAAYAGLLLLIAVGAYVMVGVAEEPTVTVENPEYTLGDGDEFAIGDRTYTVSEVSGSADASGRTATVTWINASEKQTVALGNGSQLPAINVTWPGQTARTAVTFANGSAVRYNGVSHTMRTENGSITLVPRNVSVSVGDTFPYRGNQTNVTAAGNQTVTLEWNTSENATLADGSTVSYNRSEYTVRVRTGGFNLTSNATLTFALGDTLTYRDNRTTLVAAEPGNATLARGDSYNVSTRTVSNDSLTFRESFNVSRLLRDDPAVENETESINGTSHVIYTNNSIQPLSEYLPDPETKNFTEGDSIRYDTPGSSYTYEDVIIEDVDGERALLSWRGPVPYEVPLEHGTNVTLGPDDQLHVAHFPDNETVELTSNIGDYQSQLTLQDSFKQRTNGLWGIVIIAGFGGVFLIGAAYLPSRY